MSGFDSRLVHSLVIERATSGAEDEYGQPSRTWATLSEVPGLVQPKTARELAQLNSAGAVVSTYSIYARPTEVQPSDRIRVLEGSMTGVYEIDGVRDEAGLAHHLKIDARQVEVA